MSNLTKNSQGVWSGSETLNKQSSTLLIPTGGKYTDTDISLALSVKSGSATTPATTISAPSKKSSSVSSSGVVTITTNSATQSVTPSVTSGWVSSGTAGAITVSGGTYTHTLAGATFVNVVNGTTTDLPLVSAEGFTGVKYINKLTVPTNKILGTIENNGTVSRLFGTGTAIIKTNDSAKISMETGSTLYLTDSVTGNTWIIKTDSTNNALSIEQQ